MGNENLLIALALSGSALFLLTTVFIIFIIHSAKKKQTKHKYHIAILHQQFENTKLQAQTEITEQTLQNISQEIHDNIGQRLSLASIYLNEIKETDEKTKQAAHLIETALVDLRNLSRSLSGNYVLQRGIELAIEHESELINASGRIHCMFNSFGDKHNLTEQQEVILFRCVQEALNNAVKHSEGTHIKIEIQQNNEAMTIHVQDNGIGIPDPINLGIGLESIRQRITLIGGSFTMEAVQPNGTCLIFNINTVA